MRLGIFAQADRTLGKGDAGAVATVARVKCDIADLRLAGVPFLQARACPLRNDTSSPSASAVLFDHNFWHVSECLALRQCCSDERITVTRTQQGEGSADVGLVLLAKHLCGAGTDVALRCGMQCEGSAAAAGSAADGRPAGTAATAPRLRLLGVAVAPCCHHRCTYGAYVNRPFLERHGARLTGSGGTQN